MNLQQMLSHQALNMMGKQLGFNNGIPSQYVELASTLLMGGMSRNVQSPQGAESLFNALMKDHSGSSNNILGNLIDFLPGAASNNRNGKILDHVFGQKLDPIITAFANATGLPKDRAKKLLIMIAPIVLAYLANKVTKNNLSKQQLAEEVQREYREPQTGFQTKNDGGLLQQLLDRDNDGNYMDEAAGLLKQLIFK